MKPPTHPEPWALWARQGFIAILDAEGFEVCGPFKDTPEKRQALQRIVSCVNACACLKNPALSKQEWTVKRALRNVNGFFYRNPGYNLTPREAWYYAYKLARGTWNLSRQLLRDTPEP